VLFRSGGAGGGESSADYRSRYREYVGNIPGMFTGRGKYVTPPGGGTARVWEEEPGTRMSFTDVLNDMVNIQNFNPSDVVKALRPQLAVIKRKKPQLYPVRVRQLGKMIASQIPGTDVQRVNKLVQLLGISRDAGYDILGIGPGNA